MRDSTPLRSSAATSKGPLPVPLQKNLNQRTTPWEHSCRSEPENDVLPGTPSLCFVPDGSPIGQLGECRLINGESPGHLVPHCAPDLTPTTAKSSEPGACRCRPKIWSRSFSLSNYPSLHLSSHWFAVFCTTSEAPLANIARRARSKQTSGAVVSSMNSLNEFALCSLSYYCWNLPSDSCLPSLYNVTIEFPYFMANVTSLFRNEMSSKYNLWL